MGGINLGRWLGGGVAAGAVIWVLEGAASVLYMDDMQAALDTFGLGMDMTTTTWALTVVLSLLLGLAVVFFYAAARPRFGPGPKTAITVALALFLASYVPSLAGYYMIGLYPAGMLAMWAVVGLVEIVIAGLVGGAIYREAPAPDA